MMFMGYSGADKAISWRNAAAVTSTRLSLMAFLAVAMAAPCGWGGTFVSVDSDFLPPAVYTVEAFESLPTMGFVGLCIVVAICIVAGALVILRRGE